jgi:glycosyltransferase involved in cell wall biosynthesis
MVDLSVIIPTHNRVDVLGETLERLAAQETKSSFELVVVDDGSTDGTVATLRSLARAARVPMCVMEQAQRGPAAARNRGIEAARGAVSLFLGDDTRPRADLVERHARFHRRRPEPQAALLGRVEWAPESPPTPFMEWLHTGIQFDFAQIRDPDDVPASCFYTANVSVKTAFVRAHGGFDEAFPHAAFEDLELGFRLERAGMRLVYDAGAVVEHWHPVDLRAVLTRMRTLGRSAVLLHERFPDWPLGRRPGARHRTKAALLTPLNLVPLGSTRLRHGTWQFLCHEAFREGCWEVEPRGEKPLRIGSLLARLAEGDPATWKPSPKPPEE